MYGLAVLAVFCCVRIVLCCLKQTVSNCIKLCCFNGAVSNKLEQTVVLFHAVGLLHTVVLFQTVVFVVLSSLVGL
jgi:hypothetical protein